MQLITSTKQANEEFYPTPERVARKLLEGIKWYTVSNILEPSVGKGDLIRAIINSMYDFNEGHSSNHIPVVDTIEVDPYLRSIVQYEYCGTKAGEIRQRRDELEKLSREYIPEEHKYRELNPDQQLEYDQVREEFDKLSSVKVFIVGDDFLTFNSHKQYNLIVMNPPFSNGDEHLIRAIQLIKDDGGMIRCILNAETLRNPYSLRRQTLRQLLNEYNAEIEYMEDAFMLPESERKTDVEIAIVKLNIPEKHRDSVIFERLTKAAEQEDTQFNESDITDMTVADFMSQIVTRFDVEVKAGIELIREYKAMVPYILHDFDTERGVKSGSPILNLTVSGRDGRDGELRINEYIKQVRIKYWKALFTNKQFIGKLTSELQNKYSKMVDKLVDYDFTLFNIQTLAEQMQADMSVSIQDTIIKLFDKMTQAHAWYPECSKNIHYYNGWATNKAHKINSKVILPVNGLYSDWGWSTGKLNTRAAEETILDIEKVFDYLDGGETEPVLDLKEKLERARESGNARNIVCKYFDVTIYKKGTMHIKFHRQDLVDKFNIYCGRHKNWLPPSYGKAKYGDLGKEERDVIDGFNGDGTEGSGEKEYSKVVNRSAYYLCEVKSPMLALGSGQE